MLSIGKLANPEYVLGSIAQSPEEYYLGHGEATGVWLGSGRSEFGLNGEVDADTLRAVIAGEHPATGTRLAAENRRIAGYDLCFRAPKSVSLLFGLGDPDVSRVVRDCHDQAVEAGLDYIERAAGWARRGQDGVRPERNSRLIAAAFRHRTSREGDPHLHTHVVTANMVHNADGTWTTLDGQPVYAHAKAGGCIYEAELRRLLTLRLGIEWGPVSMAVNATMESQHGLTAHASTFDRRSVIIEWTNHLPQGLAPAEVESLADQFLARTEVVSVSGPSDTGDLATAGRAKAGIYSTRELVTLEQRMMDDAVSRIHDTVGIVDEEHLATALAARPTISTEQARLVATLTTSGAGVDVVNAPAGTGKTFCLDAARDAWEAAAHTVIGCALAARAAAQLESSAGIPSSTIARLLIDLDTPEVTTTDGGRTFQAGDRILALRNDKRRGLTNGSVGTVTAVDPCERTVTVQLDTGTRCEVPPNYLDAGHLAHGYATTAHKAQGLTCDRALLLGNDALYRELGYVGLSRGRLGNHLYVVGRDRDETPNTRAPIFNPMRSRSSPTHSGDPTPSNSPSTPLRHLTESQTWARCSESGARCASGSPRRHPIRAPNSPHSSASDPTPPSSSPSTKTGSRHSAPEACGNDSAGQTPTA